MSNTVQASSTEAIARSKIGIHVTYFALTVTALVALTAILIALTGHDPDKNFAYVKDVLTIVLPLLGTWVGTVLAFYFSRENFVAAANQTADLVRQFTPEQRLQSIPVTKVMLDMTTQATTKLIISTETDIEKIRLKADIVETIFDTQNRNRLPIVDSTGRVLHVLHRSLVDKFLVKYAEMTEIPSSEATLKDLLEQQDLKIIFQSFATVNRDAKLITVKLAMDGNPSCSDAFVTEDGTKRSAALGWITNVIVQENSTA